MLMEAHIIPFNMSDSASEDFLLFWVDMVYEETESLSKTNPVVWDTSPPRL